MPDQKKKLQIQRTNFGQTNKRERDLLEAYLTLSTEKR